jgi:hypothetical protein
MNGLAALCIDSIVEFGVDAVEEAEWLPINDLLPIKEISPCSRALK